MSVSQIASAGRDVSLLLQSLQGRRPDSNRIGAGQGGESFLSSLQLRLAEIKSQTFDVLLSSPLDGPNGQSSTNFDALFASGNVSANSSAHPIDALLQPAATAASTRGRNAALFDPESAYRMMSLINAKDLSYKAEFSEMQDMRSYLTTLRDEVGSLGNIDAATANDDIHAGLKTFADAYNGWIRRFDQDLQAGGVLAGTQAAQVSQWELEQSVESFFNGATLGLHGMRDLGFTIDATTNLASIDGARLDSVLAANKAGVIDTVRQFSADFGKAAALLQADGNFISGRLDNLDRVIDYLGANTSSLQTEFGLGDAAKPSGQVAQALANYNAIHGLTAGS